MQAGRRSSPSRRWRACPRRPSAALSIGADRVVVTTSAGRAVIDPDPFRITFKDRSGRTLLREVPNRLPEGRPLPLTRDPEPFALEREPDHANYLPARRGVRPGAAGAVERGLLDRRHALLAPPGSAHFAHRALNAVPIRNGVRMEVSTSSRRRLLVRVVADVGGSIRVRLAYVTRPG